MDWQEEPATQQQLLRLQEYGFVPTFPLTVTQAARLIRQYSKHPGRAPALPVTEPAPPTPTPSKQATYQSFQPSPAPPAAPVRTAPAPGGKVSDHARLHAYGLRLEMEQAHARLAENPERPGGRADVHSAVAARQQFWFDTCREDNERHATAPEALEFHLYFGARYFPPTWGEVGEVLDALDLAMQDWDKEHPELFYETLKLNFPSLLRHK